MALIKKAPMFLDHNGSIGTCKVLKDSIEIDKDFIYFLKPGKLSTPKIRQSERFKKNRVAKDHTFVIPGGAEHHKYDRSGILGLCNLRPICALDMTRIMDKLKDERDEAIINKNKFEKKVKELQEKVDELNEKVSKSGKIE